MSRRSALGWVLRTVLISGSSTGFMVEPRWAPSLASLRRTRAADGGIVAGVGLDVSAGSVGTGALWPGSDVAGPSEAGREGSGSAGGPAAGSGVPASAEDPEVWSCAARGAAAWAGTSRWVGRRGAPGFRSDVRASPGFGPAGAPEADSAASGVGAGQTACGGL